MSVVLCDVDGISADFIGGVCRWLRDRGVIYRTEDFHDFVLGHTIPRDMADALGREIGFCSSLPWYPGAFEFMVSLRECSDLDAVTAPWNAPTWTEERRHWLSRVLPSARVASVPTPMKPMIMGDLLIEDRAETCDAWLACNPLGTALLFDRPWNRKPIKRTAIKNAVRVHSYKEILSYVQDRNKRAPF